MGRGAVSDSSTEMRYQNPRNLWEALALLSDLQHEQAQAVREGDRQRLSHLMRRRMGAWAYVRLCAERLAQRGEAPADFPHRLRECLRVSPGQEEWLQALRARAEVGERLCGLSEKSRLAA